MRDFVGAVEGVSAAIVVIRREFDLHLIMRGSQRKNKFYLGIITDHMRGVNWMTTAMHDELCRSRCRWQYICEQRGMTRSLHETD